MSNDNGGKPAESRVPRRLILKSLAAGAVIWEPGCGVSSRGALGATGARGIGAARDRDGDSHRESLAGKQRLQADQADSGSRGGGLRLLSVRERWRSRRPLRERRPSSRAALGPVSRGLLSGARRALGDVGNAFARHSTSDAQRGCAHRFDRVRLANQLLADRRCQLADWLLSVQAHERGWLRELRAARRVRGRTASAAARASQRDDLAGVQHVGQAQPVRQPLGRSAGVPRPAWLQSQLRPPLRAGDRHRLRRALDAALVGATRLRRRPTSRTSTSIERRSCSISASCSSRWATTNTGL